MLLCSFFNWFEVSPFCLSQNADLKAVYISGQFVQVMSTKNGSVVCANKSKHFWSDLDIFVEKGGLLGRSFLFAGFCALDLKLDENVTQMSSK